MKIRKIAYRRLRNLGNFENETIEMEADVENPDNIIDEFAELKWTVNRLLGLRSKFEDIRYVARQAFETDEREDESE